MKPVAVKPAAVMRIALAVCCIVAGVVGYRMLVAASPAPSPRAAFDRLHRDGAPARPVAGHRAPPSRAIAQAASAAAAASGAQVDAPTPAATPREKLAALRAPVSVESANDPFTASSWLPPPPVEAPLPTARPAPPTAPPVPFTYVGELDAKADKPQVFLSNGDQLLIVSPGDVIDGQYRVDAVSASNVVLTYLPLNQTQVVSIPVEAK
ncbi:hypothetical protein WJ47_11085 [Burkholderia ubonensis]|uniref:Proline rich protein n=1 Tax=Burkholderia ubonensis TaxID=101571 RepID=A0AB73G350_9BURK|nr:hypothetical protein [Burkholderia ubonensis]KVG75759.1 hypothetical protein WJ34_09170 [Burkholderia ubonensis]KVH20815.1 hypothetical protein WJ37_03355 [Burkholderia ubonensis]KVH47145.1 hypothetical protein WJ38_21220 [Burkholderia ubonensis]KVH85301.1 hypothetical protein WJ43_12565 [Burkholderia ubonensis]KVK80710.1 hypothetical protein WJ44_09980 [Burkholderia ubonensis]